MGFIIVSDEKKSEILKEKNFKYVITKIGDKSVYAFKKTDELVKYLCKNYSEKDYITTRKINF